MHLTPDLLEDVILPRVEKPNRYLGNIHNLRLKPAAGRLRVLLAVPDLLERAPWPAVARLRRRIDSHPDAAAELCFAPAPDFAAQLKEHRLPLASLETCTPAGEFDLLVFHLGSELQATGLLEMLSLGGLPLQARERGGPGPLVAAGGPAAFNPEPLAEFVDLFALGDLEAGLAALIDTAARRRAGDSRETALRDAARRPGLYVPSQYDAVPGPGGRLCPRPRGDAPAEVEPLWSSGSGSPECAGQTEFLLPLTELQPDRLTVEAARGCSTGCRVCRSGFPHRAPRALPAEAVADEVARGLEATGWEEACLALPAGGPGGEVPRILERLDQLLLGRQLVVGLDAAAGPELLGRGGERRPRLRRGVLHLAPVTGSAPLRERLGLSFSEEAFLAAVREARRQGWHSLKVRLTVGLPGETPADVEASGALMRRAQAAARETPADAEPSGSFQVSVSAEVFVPRPHTRFEREPLGSLEELRGRAGLLRRWLPKGRAPLRRGAVERAYVEGLLARGDRRMGRAVLLAWQSGCRPGGMEENGDLESWRQAIAEAGLEEAAARAGFEPSEPLPWGMFRDPRAWDPEPGAMPAAASAEEAPPGGDTPAAAASAPDPRLFGRKPRRTATRSTWQRGLRFRLEYGKGPEIRFTSHLELVRALERAVRRAGLPLAYSQGQSPHARIASGPPLPLGFTSRAEYLDVEFSRSVDESFLEDLNAALNCGLRVGEAVVLTGKPAALSAAVDTLSWRAWLSPRLLQALGLTAGEAVQRWAGALEELGRAGQPVLWPAKPGPTARQADVRATARSAAAECRADIPEIRFDTPVSGGIRPEWFVARLTGMDSLDPRLVRVERTAQWVTSANRRLTPLLAIPPQPGVLAAATDWS